MQSMSWYTAMSPGTNRRNDGYEQPDFPTIFKQMNERKNMTLVYLWSRYQKDCIAKAAKPYQYRQFCELYWSLVQREL